MPNNTYEGDVGIKYNFSKDHIETDEKESDIFAGGINYDEDDEAYDADVYDEMEETEHFPGESESTSESGFSVISESERKYRWEKPQFKDGADPNSDLAPKSRRLKRMLNNDSDSEDEENYDLEIGNNSVGLKILMGLMLITFIVIISVLIYKLTVLNDEFKIVLEKLEAAPTVQEIQNLKAEISDRELTIKELTDELSRYRAFNAVSGELIETPEGSIYVVATNDTLGGIAQEFEVSVAQIMEWNDLANADNIKVGQRLIVKKADEITED